MAVNLDQTPKKVEDAIRALPANQGLNDNAMWLLIDTAVAADRTATTLNENNTYLPANKHGQK